MQYKVGQRIRLIYMNDFQSVPRGTCGTITSIDDVGQLHMRWDTGSSLALNPDEDAFEVLEE